MPQASDPARRSEAHPADCVSCDVYANAHVGVLIDGPTDFCKALREHAAFVASLREHVYGVGVLDHAAVHSDTLCPLSQWLAGIAACYQRFPEYEALRLAHAVFHVRAATVVSMVNSGRRIEAEAEFACGGSLRRCSSGLVRAITAFRHRISADACGRPA